MSISFEGATAYTLGRVYFNVVNAQYVVASVGIYSERHPTCLDGTICFVELAPPISADGYELAAQEARDAWDNEHCGFGRQWTPLWREWIEGTP